MAEKLTSQTVRTMIKITKLFIHDTEIAKKKYWAENKKSSPQSDFYETAESRAEELLDKLHKLEASIVKDEKKEAV